jgi:hypothetical protein
MMWLTLKKSPRKKGMPLDAWTTSYIVWLRQVAAAGGYEQSGHPLARSCEATIQALVPALRPRLDDARFIFARLPRLQQTTVWLVASC